MEQILAANLVNAAVQLEQQLDSEINRLDNLGSDDIDAIRERRMKEMKLRQEKLQIWKQNVRRKLHEATELFFLTKAIHFLGPRRVPGVGRREGILRGFKEIGEHRLPLLS